MTGAIYFASKAKRQSGKIFRQHIHLNIVSKFDPSGLTFVVCVDEQTTNASPQRSHFLLH